MDKYQGDLTDIIRASTGGSYGATSSSEASALLSHHDHFQFCSDPMNFSSVLGDTRVNLGTDPYFSDNMREDPFLHMAGSSSACFQSANSAEIITSGGLEEAASYCFGNGGVICSSTRNSTSVLTQQIPEDDDMTMSMPCNNSIFSNMIQISPDAKLCDSQVIKPSAVVSSNMINANTIKDCMVRDNTGGAQISSPRNPGLKRSRKNQAKKAICIPAPSPAANSRQGGEVVPSDLWAWRKYGQKPIKGSPYPRGYYRCSSSKGCSARKQVERSRTDPNMLVITYTSEHNHPWPTQRNALAGSTRLSQPYSKNNNNNIAAPIPNNSLETTHQPQKGTLTKPKEERQSSNDNNSGNSSSKSAASVKEEIKDIEKLKLETNDIGDQLSNGMIPYKPSMLMCNQSEDLFAKLTEIVEEEVEEEDSLNLLALDPFHLFEW